MPVAQEPMRERFQLYHRFDETVLPLTGGISELEQMASLPFSGFACCSPGDSSSETPQVPTFLPRQLPEGTYSWGAYFDDGNFYVAMDAEDASEVAVSDPAASSLDQLMIFQPDGLWYSAFQLELDGRSSARTVAYQHGPRRIAGIERAWTWDVRRWAIRAGKDRTLWRISRHDLTSLICNGALRLSISRTSVRSLEAVAWGAYGIWGPRFDECGTVRFAENPASPLAPRLRNLDLSYDPERITAQLNFEWDHPYETDESLPSAVTERWRSADWSVFTARVNGQLQRFSFADDGPSAPFALCAGFNEIHVTCRGSAGVHLFLDVAAGDRIVVPEAMTPANPFIEDEGATRCVAVAWVRRWLQEFINQRPAPWTRYEPWMGRLGSAVAEWCRESQTAPAWRAWVHELGLHTLSFQRDDGTFAGYHLGTTGCSDVLWQGGAYDSGQIGDFWVRCYRATADGAFLDASRRLMNAYDGYRVEFNHNFAAFGLYHLASHYQVTGDPIALRQIEFFLQHAVTRYLLPLGFHGGHNYYTVYASIILTGMARAAAVLEDDHPLRDRLMVCVRRMANQTLARIQADGSFDSRDRHFAGETLWIDGLFAVAPLLAGPERRHLDGILHGILQKAVAASAVDPSSSVAFAPSQASSLAGSPVIADYLLSIVSTNNS